MQYYSEKTKRLYGSVEELQKAEKEIDKKQKEVELAKAEKAKAAKRVEEALKLKEETARAYQEELNSFIKKYGAYHSTVTATSTDGGRHWTSLNDAANFLSDFLDNLPILF